MKIYYAANTDMPEGAALPRMANEIIPALTAASLSDPAQLGPERRGSPGN